MVSKRGACAGKTTRLQTDEAELEARRACEAEDIAKAAELGLDVVYFAKLDRNSLIPPKFPVDGTAPTTYVSHQAQRQYDHEESKLLHRWFQRPGRRKPQKQQPQSSKGLPRLESS